MVTSWTIYWLTRLDWICGSLEGAIIISLVIAGLLGFAFIPASVEESEYYMKGIPVWIRKMLAIAAIAASVRCFIPSTKEMAAIIVIPAIANSQTATELGSATVTLAKEWLEELRPKKAEPTKEK